MNEETFAHHVEYFFFGTIKHDKQQQHSLAGMLGLRLHATELSHVINVDYSFGNN